MEQRTRKAIWEIFPASCSLHQEIDREIHVAEINERLPEVGRLLVSISEGEEKLRNFEIGEKTVLVHEPAEVIEIPQTPPKNINLAA